MSNGYPYALIHQFSTLYGTIEAQAVMTFKNDGSLYDEVKDKLIEIVEQYTGF